MIELKNISKDFGSGEKAVHAVRDVSLSIGSGEIFGIIGFSGAGKSTLVRCINLLERPSSGSVFVAGQDLTALSAKDLRAARKKIGMIFQHFNLMPSRTVAGNVAYPLKGSGLSKEDIQKKVADYYKIRVADMHSKSRPRVIAYPRQIAMYLSKKLTQKSYPEIGELFGGKDHTTVLHACKKIESDRRINEELNHELHVLEQNLQNF